MCIIMILFIISVLYCRYYPGMTKSEVQQKRDWHAYVCYVPCGCATNKLNGYLIQK